MKRPSTFDKSYMALLMLGSGSNSFRIGDFGIGSFVIILLCALVWSRWGIALVFNSKIRLAPLVFLGLALMVVCAVWAAYNGDWRLFSSLIVLITSYAFINRWVNYPGFLFRYVFITPFFVCVAFYILYVIFPSLVYEPDAGGKYIQIGSLMVLRFEGAVLNANAYGISAAILLFCLTYQGYSKTRLAFGYISLLISFSYSGFISFLYLIGVRLKSFFGLIIAFISIIALLPTYAYVKGWGISESSRVIKYTFYSANLLDQSFHDIMLGGIERSGHEWVILSDNVYLTLIYDHGLIFLLVYFVAFAILLRRAKFLLLNFLFVSFVVDLQFFWLANLMFLIAATLMSPERHVNCFRREYAS